MPASYLDDRWVAKRRRYQVSALDREQPITIAFSAQCARLCPMAALPLARLPIITINGLRYGRLFTARYSAACISSSVMLSGPVTYTTSVPLRGPAGIG